MSKSESFDSFFNRSDFDFAKNNEKLEQKNEMTVNIFQQVLLQGTEINGYIFLKVNTKLPEGKIFLRIECVSTTNLDRGKPNVPATESKEALKQRFASKAGKPKDIKSAIFMLKKLSIGVEKPKAGFGADLLSNSTIQLKKQKTSDLFRDPNPRLKSVILEKESPIRDPVKTTSKLSLLEWEVFKLEKTIEKAVYLFLPFRISLDQQICITTEQVFSQSIEDLQGKLGAKIGKLPPIIEYGNYVAKLRNEQKWDNQSGAPATDRDHINRTMTETLVLGSDMYEYIKMGTKITAYYVTNSTFAEFAHVPKGEKLERYSQDDNFCVSTRELMILANYKALGYRHWRQSVEIFNNKGSFEIEELKEEKTEVLMQKHGTNSSLEIDPQFRLSINTSEKTVRKKPQGCSKLIASLSGLVSRLKSTIGKHDGQRFKASLSLEQTIFTNEEDQMNFVLRFDAALLKSFKHLDVLIWGKNNYLIEEKMRSIDKILFHESFNLTEKLPSCLMGKPSDLKEKSKANSAPIQNQLEYLNTIFIGNLTSHLQTIESSTYNLTFSAEFYVSSSSFGLDLLLFQSPLVFLRLPEEFVLFDSDYISNIHLDLEKRLSDPDSSIRVRSVMLPYTHIQVGEKYGEDKVDD